MAIRTAEHMGEMARRWMNKFSVVDGETYIPQAINPTVVTENKQGPVVGLPSIVDFNTGRNNPS